MHEGKPWAKRHARRITGSERHKAKLKRYNRDIDCYPSPVYVKTRNGSDSTYLKRLYKSGNRNSTASRYLVICNRKVRRYKGEIAPGGDYRKISDYWWMLY